MYVPVESKIVRMALPLDGYVRVSRVGDRDGKDGFISPEVQEQAIRDWAERSGVEVVIQPHELNRSGGTMDRPVFNEIMDRVREGKSGGIVVYKTDRFARTLQGAVSTLAELGEHRAAFASVSEPGLDYATPSGRAFLHMLFVFAEFIRSSLKESWAIAARSAIERGIHIAPNGYFGYDKDPKTGRLVPNDQAPLVVEIFRRRGRGDSWPSIADWLNDVAAEHAPSRVAKGKGKHAPDGVWTGGHVQRLCSKRVYRGEASRYIDQDKDCHGAVVNRGAHPALVTEEEWQAAQMDPRQARGGGLRRNENPQLLSGLIRCAGCRYSLSLGNGPQGEQLYRCRGKHASGSCPQPAAVLSDKVEAHVEELVLAELDGLAEFVPDNSEREAAIARLEQAREGLDDFKRDIEARRKLGADWHEWLDRYLEEVRSAEAELDRVTLQAGVVETGLTRDLYLALPIDERREVLAGFVDVVFVRRSRGRGRHVDPMDRRVCVLWRGQGPTDLPRRRVANEIRSFDWPEGDVEAGVVPAQDAA